MTPFKRSSSIEQNTTTRTAALQQKSDIYHSDLKTHCACDLRCCKIRQDKKPDSDIIGKDPILNQGNYYFSEKALQAQQEQLTFYSRPTHRVCMIHCWELGSKVMFPRRLRFLKEKKCPFE